MRWTCLVNALFLVSGPARAQHGGDLPVQEVLTDKANTQEESKVLRNFQVQEPIFVPEGTENRHGCIHRMTLMDHVFGSSYGYPFVGSYKPPPCDFNRVVINLTVTSRGRQYDRLGHMYLGDVEVFRTSTAEPTESGIIWTYLKEMQMYNALWKQPQKLIFDLPNLLNHDLDGTFNATLTATFFTVPSDPPVADHVLPISSRSSEIDEGSAFLIPPSLAAIHHKLPNTINRAMVSISACGQMDEEFWYSNVPDSDVGVFGNFTGLLPGHGTFREVRLLIDGQLAGIAMPFGVIFTGGIVPGLWRPIAGIEAFDLRQSEIDVTPWLGYLLDGKSHSFEIRVASVSDDGKGNASLVEAPGSLWKVSGSIFLFEDPEGGETTGSKPEVVTSTVELSFSNAHTRDANGMNDTLLYNTFIGREFVVTSTIRSGKKEAVVSTWSQSMRYSNTNKFIKYGAEQLTFQKVSLNNQATGPSNFNTSFGDQLTVLSAFNASGGSDDFSIFGQVVRSKSYLSEGNPIFPDGRQNLRTAAQEGSVASFCSRDDSTLRQQEALSNISAQMQHQDSFAGTQVYTTQAGTAQYRSVNGSSSSFGTTLQYYNLFGETDTGSLFSLYRRIVRAVNTTIDIDIETVAGVALSTMNATMQYPNLRDDADGLFQSAGRGQIAKGLQRPRKHSLN